MRIPAAVRIFLRTFLLYGLWLSLFAGSAHSAAAAKWVSLFDGKTLKGWEGDEKVFRVEQGAIVGGNLQQGLPGNQFLCTTHEYKNFKLRAKCKLIGKGANGGIQFRSQRVPKSSEMIGYQADMDAKWWGNLYEESRRKKVLAGPSPEQRAKIVHPDDWNDYVIVCRGNRVQLWLNGVKTVDYTETDKGALPKGILGLQIHAGGPSEAWYKDIEIRELPGK
jgi:hypothetical protein